VKEREKERYLYLGKAIVSCRRAIEKEVGVKKKPKEIKKVWFKGKGNKVAS